MSAWLTAHALDAAAQKWRALAERRRLHFIELYHSGRWKRYYSEQQFLDRLRDAIRMSEKWSEIAPPSPEPGHSGEQSISETIHRTAA